MPKKSFRKLLSIYELEASCMSCCGHEDDEYGFKWIENFRGDKTRNSSESLSVILLKMISSTSSYICQRLINVNGCTCQWIEDHGAQAK